jgi:peroxiredoxin
LAVISYDRPEPIAAFAKQRGITFPLLSDAGSATIRKFGILNPVPEWAFGPNREDPAVQSEVQKYVSVRGPNPSMVGMAFPGTFVLDRQARVTSRFFEDFYVDRSTVSSIIMRLGDRPESVPGVRISTDHLEATLYSSDSAVAPGNRMALAVEVKPRSRMHIYAPGASKYRIIALNLAPQPFLRVLPAKYPASETYHFKPLDERVPVFQKPFTFIQEVVIEGTPPAQAALSGKDAITLAGTLDYQACDDKICYNPASIPVSLTLSLRPLLRDRP